jgi:beta-D-xylosidase 4
MLFVLALPVLFSLVEANSVCPFSTGNYKASASLQGCYSDQDGSRALSGPEFVLGNENTPQTCADLCGSAGYSYSGVEYTTYISP